MHQTGMLVVEFPAVLGSDFSGVVLETGSGCDKLKKGDYVFACCNLGQNQSSPFQESILVDETSLFTKTDNISREQATSIGVGIVVCLRV